jgi:hypothetical protein
MVDQELAAGFDDLRIAIPVEILGGPVTVPPRTWLAKEFGLATRGLGFEGDFPDLELVTRNYADLPLQKVRDILDGERERSAGERVEILGMKIPSSGVRRWGSVIVLVVQLYLCLHLNALRVSLVAKQNIGSIAWVGLYPDLVSRIVCLFSILIMPWLSILLLGAPRPWGVIAVSIALASGSATLLCMIWIRLRRPSRPLVSI